MTAPVTQTRGAGQSIAMTAPVTQTADGEAWVVRFIMPAQYTLETLPRPTDARIRIVALPARRVAVIRFTGFRTESSMQRQEAALREAMALRGLQATVGQSPTYAFYDPPWTPFFLRRNEVMVTLAAP